MKADHSRIHRLLRCTSVFALLVSILLAQITVAQAQKLPPILDTGTTDPSAFDIASVKKIKADYDAKVVSTTAADRELAKQSRNRLIGIGREQVDAMFFGYIKKDRKKRALFQFLLDFLEIGAATAIGITNGERAKTVISEGLGAVQAGRTSLNKNFQLLERQILINKMAADRAVILTTIISKRDLDVVQYPWEDARADLRTYRNAGTLDGAMSSLSSSVGKEKSDAEDKLREVKDQPMIGAATLDDQTSAKSAFDVRRDLEAALKDPARSAAALATLQKIVAKLQEDKVIAQLLKDKKISPTTDNGTTILVALRDIRESLTTLNRRDLVRKVNEVTAEVGNQQ